MAINFSALNQVYNHYLTAYAPKTNSPFDTHKKSELRSMYNSIIKLNKDSPLYILDTDDESKEYAISLKESARQLRHAIIATCSDQADTFLDKKMAYSDNESIATASYIGSQNNEDEIPSFSIEVSNLASPQVNLGQYLKSSENGGLPPNDYSFDVHIGDLNYEFQMQIHENDTNRDIQERLCRLFSNADVGINATILDDGQGNSALQMESAQTGNPYNLDYIFRINDENTSKHRGLVSYLGIGEISSEPANALFHINGIEHSSAANTFTVEKLFEVSLHEVSQNPNDIANIGLKNDTESLVENIHTLTDGYNSFIQTASSYSGSHVNNHQLLKDISNINTYYKNDLAKIGLNFQENGSLTIDEPLLRTGCTSDLEDTFSSVKNFAGAILRKSNQISLDPMQYVNKTIVAYKNPGKSFASPYITSSYSGMLFNNYC